MLRVPSFQKWALFVLVAGLAHAQPVQKPLADPPHFTIHDAIQAEWMRTAPNLKVDALPKADRERYQLALQRIGAPGMPKLLPPELGNPTAEIWEAKAKEAKTPQERFTALHFLNRLKSPKALTALDGLRPEDAKTWPKHLYLDANIATARLQGGEVSKELQSFLDALKHEEKTEPVRAQAARLRLVMAGKEKELLPLIPPSPGTSLALMDALNRSRPDQRVPLLAALVVPDLAEPWKAIGMLSAPPREIPNLERRILDDLVPEAKYRIGIISRVREGLPKGTTGFPLSKLAAYSMFGSDLAGIAYTEALGNIDDPKKQDWLRTLQKRTNPLIQAALLPTLRGTLPEEANALRRDLLTGPDPIARSAAIEDLAKAPVDLDALTRLTWKDRDLEPQQTLIESYSRWKLPKEKQIELLKPWLQHSDWACRYLAYQQLVKLDGATHWPAAPEPNEREKTLINEAERLASSGKPLRLRITFSGKRQVTLRLDPTVAPINVANISTLARKGFFNGRLVPRVVPDFVVQMGSPYDTMDGGPGYSVRCENSLVWYGPGSVGMALSGKDTGGSQFFIATNATPHLTGKYTRMGEVEDLDNALKLLDDLELGAKIERVEVL